MKARVATIFILFGSLWGLLLVRVFILQIFPHQKLERLESKQYETTVRIEGRRGSIYDRNGVELAMSAPAYSLYGDPKELWDKKADVVKVLQKNLNLKSKDLIPLFKDKQKRFVWIQRQLSLDQAEKIKALKIRGLGFIEEPIRVYPDADIMKSILGTVGRSGMGMEGIERQYDSTLRGNPKKIQVRRDARGRPLQVNGLLITEAEEGTDVQLTIDRELQYVLHREISKTIEEQQAAGAVGIILDAQTSEVRAMDAVGLPMGGERLNEENWRNRPILEAFEPGSTMKTFIIAQGLMQKGWQPNTKFDCENGELKIGKRTIGEADSHHKFGWLTISEILAVSSNVGITKMAFSLGESEVKKALERFGFGRKSGIDLPGEARGIIQPGRWSQHLLSNVSFGHGLTATPIQIANAYAAIANGGILNVPKITKQISKSFSSWNLPWDKKNNSIELPKERIITEAQAQTLRLLLAGVMAPGGTGVSAVVPGFPVAGKTGTAQKVNPNGRGYLPGAYISSFVGMIPANSPRFIIYVAIDTPQKQYYGSQVAGPLFSKIATYAVRHEGLAPRWLNENQAEGLLPDLANNKVIYKTKEDSISEAAEPTKEGMPNLTGLTLREVQEHLQNQNLRVSIHGSGKVIKYHPVEGTKIENNEKVELWFE